MQVGFGHGELMTGSKKRALLCSCGCGQQIERWRSELNDSGLNYVSGQHAGAHRTRLYLEEMCGSHLPLAEEYLDGYAKQHYKNLSDVRSSICSFLLFLTAKSISSLEDVKPKTITEFLTWADDVEYENAGHDISNLTTFFRWAICHGYRRSACPVVSKFHKSKRPRYLPKPYSKEELTFIWRLADERGSAMLRAALSIGEESGLRLGELCNLRIQDVDIEGLSLFVRLPNKTDTERFARITDRAAGYIAEWMNERASRDHDHLFYNRVGGPMKPQVMHDEFCSTFCQVHEGKIIHDEGLERWSTHRLRHTMASNLASGGASVMTIKEAGGWKSISSMLIYTKPDAELARRGYDEAMARSYDREQDQPGRKTISPDAFLAEYSEDPER